MGEIKRYTSGTQGGPVFVYVQDGKILRITPMNLTDEDAPSWSIEARGRTFTPPRKTTLAPHTAGYKSIVYSDKRALTPMKRIDFDPNGERNCCKRGESGYVPISWDEALDIVANEMKRIKREVGSAGILYSGSAHQFWGNIGFKFSVFNRFKAVIGGTDQMNNPDSWEGWFWGGQHTWGFNWRIGCPEQYDLLEDALKNTEMIVFWSSDPETTSGIYSAFESTPRRFWLKELGVEMVCIDPYYTPTAKLFSDKWIAPRLGTDNAIALAIAYTWITEDTYNKEYVESRTVGFDVWKDYVLGVEDGIPKTPEWAEEESTVPARVIRTLARKWASKKTMLAAGGLGGWGGAGRSATGLEWARLMILLAAMQGLGQPGSNIWSTTQGAPCNFDFCFPGYAEGGMCGTGGSITSGSQTWNAKMFGTTSSVIPFQPNQQIHRLVMPEAIMEGKAEWYSCSTASVESQFQKMSYPAPGQPHVQMMYRFGGSFIGTMTDTNRFAKMYRTENLQFVVNQGVYFEGEQKFADIILPVCTNLERWDIGEFANCSGYIPDTYSECNHRIISLQHKCIEPMGESKSDYEIFAALAERMGVYDEYTDGGKTELDWVKQMFYASDLPKYVTWEEFFEKGYFVVPPPENRKATPAFSWFAEDRKRDTPDWGPAPAATIGLKGLGTPSGKIEFESSTLKRFAESTEDENRPVIPKYIPSWEGHHSELFAKYPLALVSPHPRYSMHTSTDAKDSFTNDIRDHRVLIDGYYYWVARVNSVDAEKRGVKNNDLIRLFNDRGSVICCAQVGERVAPGTVHSYEACSEYDPIGTPGEVGSVDRAGCVNILAPGRMITKTASGMANNSCLIDFEKWEGSV